MMMDALDRKRTTHSAGPLSYGLRSIFDLQKHGRQLAHQDRETNQPGTSDRQVKKR